MTRLCAIAIAAAFSVRPLPQADGPLEPSVQNEVDHAVGLGERWLEKNFKKVPADPLVALEDSKERAARRKALEARLGLTNGLTRAEIALKLVSSQRGGGWWLIETNAAPTRLAVEILKGL